MTHQSNHRDNSPTDSQACTRLHQIIELQAALHPHSDALWWEGTSIDYASLQRNITTVSTRLANSGAAGDRIAVLSWNSPEFVELIYSISAAGRVMVPLNARLAPAELAYQLRSSGATSIFGSSELLGPLLAHDDFPADIRIINLENEYARWREDQHTSTLLKTRSTTLPKTRAQDPVWILFTSGSTGRPKGVVLSHRSLMAGLRSAALARPVKPADRYYYPFPLFHVSAHNVLLQHLYGATVILSQTFDATATLKSCRELQVTTMSLAPTMIALLLEHHDFQPEDLQSVRTIGYGASAMPQKLLQRLLSGTNVGLCQSYGMTELSGSIAFLTTADHQRAAREKPALLQSVGRVLPTAQLKIIDEAGHECAVGDTGEILVKAAQCMEQYWNDEAATAQALVKGWLHTGDIGRLDEDGYLYILDRKKDMIISGGENIASREIEEVLRLHTAVRDCAIIGLPDSKWGESPCAIVQLDGDIDDRALSDHCRAFLAGYKIPKRWIRVDELPLNAAGKIDKPLLRQQYKVKD